MAVTKEQYERAYRRLFVIALSGEGMLTDSVFAVYTASEYLTGDPFKFLGMGTTIAEDAAVLLQYISDHNLAPEGVTT